jgi:FtsP/CotA-like multicopper oxidase with cupredoxin domain
MIPPSMKRPSRLWGVFFLIATIAAPVLATDSPPFDARSTPANPCGQGDPPPGHAAPELRARAEGLTLTVRQDRDRLCYVANDIADAPTIRVRLGSDLTITLRNEITDTAAIDAVTGPGKLSVATARVPSSADFIAVIPGMKHHATGATNLHLHGFAVPPVKPQDDVLTVCTDPANGPDHCGQRAFTYHFHVPSDMTEGLYWYHPHVHGEVQAQMLMGLTGAIVVEGPQDDARRAAGIDERVLIVRQTQDLDAGRT